MGKQSKTIRHKRKIGVSKYQNNVLDAEATKAQISKSLSRELKFTIVSIFIVTIVMLSSAFAIFSSVQKSEKYNTLTVGTLKVDFIDTEDGMGNVINLNGAYPESDNIGIAEAPYSFKITNSGSLAASYKIKILDDSDMISEDQCSNKLLDKSKIRVSINKETAFTLGDIQSAGYEIKTGTLNAGESASFEVRMWISETSGNEVLGKHYHGKIVVEGINTKSNVQSANIIKAYSYNVSTCPTGEEPGCVESMCYIDKAANSCGEGTIILYKVNDTTEKYFYVLHDDGLTMTVQQRENTIDNTTGNIATTNSKTSNNFLQQLESATNNWTNVNSQSYEINSKTYNSIARPITKQESTALGCSENTPNSCPGFLYKASNDYWVTSSSNDNTSWIISSNGSLTNPTNMAGVRAVIVINK